jgi:ubiquinol-cytochrome c reductase cytochrome b subunit
MQAFFFIFVAVGMILGWCGAQLPDAPVIGDYKTFILIDGDLNSYLWLTRLSTLYYFAFFVVIMPFVGLKETPLRIPLSISEPVLSGPDAMSGAVPAQAEKKG